MISVSNDGVDSRSFADITPEEIKKEENHVIDYWVIGDVYVFGIVKSISKLNALVGAKVGGIRLAGERPAIAGV